MEAGTTADSTAIAPNDKDEDKDEDEDDVIFPQSDEKLKEMIRF